MAATITEIREGLAANLETLDDLQVSPWVLSNPTPPAAEIELAPDGIEYDRAMARGLDHVTLIVRVFVGLTSDVGAQKRLDAFYAPSGTDSVKAALESDCTLGGKAQDLHVQSATGPRMYGRQGQAPVLGAEWTVRVLP